MTDATARLLRIQELYLQPQDLSPEEETELDELEAATDDSLMRRVNRFFDRDRKAIVPLRGESCSGCHIKLSRAVLSGLKQGFTTQFCDNCNRVLFVAEEVPSDESAESR